MSNRVREARKRKGLSGEALARKAEMASTDLSRVERGLQTAYPGWRRRIAQALDIAEEELFPNESPASAVAG